MGNRLPEPSLPLARYRHVVETELETWWKSLDVRASGAVS